MCPSVPVCVVPSPVVATQSAHPHASLWTYLFPVVGCFASIAVGCALCHYSPPVLARVEAAIPTPHRSRAMLALFFGVAVGVAVACRAVQTSELLGCYFTGLMFSASPELRHTWPAQMKRLSRWGAALFFAATIGFSVPTVAVLFSGAAAGRGALVLLAATVGKSLIGFFASPLTVRNAVQFAAAMNARGEFNFQVTALAASAGVISAADAAALTWALLLLTLLTPLWFRAVFKRPKPQDDFQRVSVGEDGSVIDSSVL